MVEITETPAPGPSVVAEIGGAVRGCINCFLSPRRHGGTEYTFSGPPCLRGEKFAAFLAKWIFGTTPILTLLASLTPFVLLAQAPCLTDAVVARNALRHLPPVGTTQSPSEIPEGAVVTIPVVVHVVYKGNVENISNEQILSQIAVLNEDFRLQNTNAVSIPPLFAPLAADVGLEFCLAARDPAGNATDGITRRQTIWNNIGQLIAPDGRPRIHYTDLGGEDAWDPEHYLNLWVCNIGGGILGFATPPGTAPPAEDGVVVDARYFGRTGLAALYPPHHLGRTATHEIGHYFNLRHIWGGSGDSCDDDDDVADTPVQRSPYLGCPAFPQFSCGNSAMFMNYMDYTDDACLKLFTHGQKTRMWAALNTARAGLPGNIPCLSTPAAEPDKTVALRVYPVPVNDVLQIELEPPAQGPLRWRVVDGPGRVWFAGDNFTERFSLNVAALPAGFYLLVLENGAVVATRRFLKVPE